MGKVVALTLVAAGIALAGATLGVFPAKLAFLDASRDVRLAAAGVMAVVGFGLLARDHRGSEIISAFLLLGVSFATGWLTFYGPNDLLTVRFDFIPAAVNETLSRLMFGLGVIACGVTAFFGLRKLLG